jgi:O-antigen ligase
MFADTEILPRSFIYFARFVPIGILALKSLATFSRKRALATRSTMLKFWAPFLIFSGISVVYSANPWISGQRYLSALFVFVGFGLGVPLFFLKLQGMRRVIKFVGFLMALAIIYSVTQLPAEGAHILLESSYRGSGVFNNPNTFGLLAMQAFFLLLYLLQLESRPAVKYSMLGAALVVGASVLLSGSRASVLGMAVGLLVLVKVNLKMGRKPLLNLFRLTTFAVVALLFIEAAYPEYLDSLFRAETSSRTILWQRAWILAQDKLWLGVGFAGSDGLFVLDSQYLKSMGIYVAGSHSSLFRLLVDLGIVGVVLAVYAVWMIWRHAWRKIRFFDDARFGAVLLSVVAASLTNAFFESWLFGFGSASTIPFWLFLALLSHQADIAGYRLSVVRRHRREQSGAIDPERRLCLAEAEM